MILALWRYRESSLYMRKEPSVHDTKLESVWTMIPVILVTVIVILSLQVMIKTEELPEDAIHITVIGRQFQWEFIYPDNTSTLNDLWIQEGQKVIFDIHAEDVIHSFFLPDFYLKVDAFPRSNDTAYIVAEPAGTYDIYCAEYCGETHDEMLGKFYIYKADVYDQPYGPPPGLEPPVPEIVQFNATLEIRELDGAVSIQPSALEIPLDAEVSLRVENNASSDLSLVLDPPYGRMVEVVPVGEARYLNFTANRPTAGTRCFTTDLDHQNASEGATITVVGGSSEGTVRTDEGDYFWLTPIIGVAAAVVLAILVLAALRAPAGAPANESEPEAGPSAEGTKGDDDDGAGKDAGDAVGEDDPEGETEEGEDG